MTGLPAQASDITLQGYRDPPFAVWRRHGIEIPTGSTLTRIGEQHYSASSMTDRVELLPSKGRTTSKKTGLPNDIRRRCYLLPAGICGKRAGHTFISRLGSLISVIQIWSCRDRWYTYSHAPPSYYCCRLDLHQTRYTLELVSRLLLLWLPREKKRN